MDSKETLTRIVLLALLLYAAVCLASVSRELHRVEAAAAALTDDLTQAQQASQALQARLESGWTAEEMETLARERLGLVRPEDRIFCFPEQAETAANNNLPTPGQGTVTETERIFHGFGSWRH
ncbi:MAG: septum formation initiator family protein [Oscillospiraceae bacterium]|nr:septum formation initiator family protein [Oscillospiraceae bacterium]